MYVSSNASEPYHSTLTAVTTESGTIPRTTTRGCNSSSLAIPRFPCRVRCNVQIGRTDRHRTHTNSVPPQNNAPQPPHHQKLETRIPEGEGPRSFSHLNSETARDQAAKYAAIRDQLAAACSQAQVVGDQCLVEDLENLLRRVKRRCGS